MATATKIVITEQQIDSELEQVQLEPKSIKKLNKFTKMAVSRLGVMGVREGSKTWEKEQRGVIRHLLEQETTVKDVEESEE